MTADDEVTVPSKNEIWLNVGLLLGQHRRRWPNIKPILIQRPVFAHVPQVILSNQINLHPLTASPDYIRFYIFY